MGLDLPFAAALRSEDRERQQLALVDGQKLSRIKIAEAVGGEIVLNVLLVLRRGGAWYEVSPYALLWDDENYYLVGYDGGAAAIRYTIDEEVTQSGVLVAGYFVPGFLQKDGSYICFFPFPYTMTAVEYKNAVELTATDMAGNVTRSRLGLLAYERNFKSDTINISDNFLASVNSKLGYLAPNAANQLEGYLYINNQVRAANVETLRALRKDTAAAMLWDGMFQRLPRSAARAGFGDHRYFTYQGKQVGESYHLGFDLASVRNAEVPAANNGRVVFTGELGIYGNLVVIDHGLGLMSLYSHLSEIHVKVGDVVQKGAIIAKTGSTGLAFGDHLHFGILVGGVEVTPLEWLA